ncbi:aspartate decarboxylase [Gordonia phage Jace]|uniref:Aspartate decarboxylase n=1 Tax=Gordonia phage Jace TaxID=2182360 RepID=A0A2U8UJ78_9CAUD|nr:aspartate decarboxylase [Gordonia phage Jace]AWN03707.1 aspartate decarboxylase [Gordonia phage Jace]
MRTFCSAKLHNIHVTGASLEYIGSVTVDADLLDAADIAPYEQIDIVNLNNGERWTTYALPGKPGVFTLNGGGARLGLPGDRCVIMSYRQEREFSGARSVFVDEQNRIVRQLRYPLTEETDGAPDLLVDDSHAPTATLSDRG